jgi:hypothetical protein
MNAERNKHKHTPDNTKSHLGNKSDQTRMSGGDGTDTLHSHSPLNYKRTTQDKPAIKEKEKVYTPASVNLVGFFLTFFLALIFLNLSFLPACSFFSFAFYF